MSCQPADSNDKICLWQSVIDIWKCLKPQTWDASFSTLSSSSSLVSLERKVTNVLQIILNCWSWVAPLAVDLIFIYSKGHMVQKIGADARWFFKSHPDQHRASLFLSTLVSKTCQSSDDSYASENISVTGCQGQDDGQINGEVCQTARQCINRIHHDYRRDAII